MPGTAAARQVIAGKFTGRCDAVDKATTTIEWSLEGLPTVSTKDPLIVPVERSRDIQRALRRFIHMVGNTQNHELGHALGIASPKTEKIQVGLSFVTSVLDGHDWHNKPGDQNNTNIMDAGGTRSFVRWVEATGVRQTFSPANARYLRDCVPYDTRNQ